MSLISNKELILSHIRTCLATYEPFMNVPDAWLLCWIAVAAFKTYYNCSTFTRNSLPKYMVVVLFWGLTFTYLNNVAVTSLMETVMTSYLSVLTVHFCIDRPLMPIILAIIGNFLNPLRFIWDVYFVLSVFTEFHQHVCTTRDHTERLRSLVIISLLPLFLSCYFFGLPGAGFTSNLVPIYVAAFFLCLMGLIAHTLDDPLRGKVACMLFAICIPWSRMIYTHTPGK